MPTHLWVCSRKQKILFWKTFVKSDKPMNDITKIKCGTLKNYVTWNEKLGFNILIRHEFLKFTDYCSVLHQKRFRGIFYTAWKFLENGSQTGPCWPSVFHFSELLFQNFFHWIPILHETEIIKWGIFSCYIILKCSTFYFCYIIHSFDGFY